MAYAAAAEPTPTSIFCAVQSFDAAREMAARGLGVCILPHWLAQADLDAGRLTEIETPLRFPVSRVYLCGLGADPRQAAIAASLKAFCRVNMA
jgi:DNA-binding transcriptional LysR family regulator